MKLSINQILLQAITMHKEGRLEEAEPIYREILKIEPKHPDANHNLGILMISINKSSEALPLFKVATEANPNIEMFWSSYGNALLFEKNYKDAKDCYERAIKLNPKNASYFNNLGIILTNLGNIKKAKDLYEKAIEIDPRYANAHNNLGKIFHTLKEKQKAKDCYEKAVKFNPNFALALSNLGTISEELNEIQKAIDYFTKSKEIDPNLDQDISFASAYLKNSDPNNALILLDRYLKKYPQDARANAYKTLSLRGLKKFDQIEKLISFPNLVKTVNTKIFKSEKMFEFNKEFRSVLISDPRRGPEKNTSGWAIRGGTVIRNLFDTTNPIVAKFEILLRKAIDHYIANLPEDTKHPFLMNKKKPYNILTCWVNFLEPGDFQANHIHNNGWISGVYYLDDPIKEPNKRHAGWIEFNRTGYNLPHFAGEKGIELIEPKSGMFIFFPSYVWHGTIPHTQKYNRISISFDIRQSL